MVVQCKENCPAIFSVRFNVRYAATQGHYVQNFVKNELFLIARNIASASTSIMIGESIRLRMLSFFLQKSGLWFFLCSFLFFSSGHI
jgi:hypothetical protein